MLSVQFCATEAGWIGTSKYRYTTLHEFGTSR